ncbi:alginate lyase [Pedobacter petrophilus]|uniref:Alginate lyase n=1 Tax=Pedobacter petrophilus TaxID=1908241 RepID=A0A7K0FZ40_9SPHI|nr:alginate lyase family protein [Pedobacter petrophilus]MRX76721.1 alginate lyase [Pedobacter petrophilus]
MRKFVFALLLLIPYSITKAQIVSLNEGEIKALKVEIENSPPAKKAYLAFQKSVSVYLNDLPNPIDTIRTEGLLKGDPRKEKTKLALADMNKMFALAIQYRLTNDQIFLNKCVKFLSAWAKINHSNGDPIDDTNLDKAIEAYDLIKTEIPIAEQRMINNWLTETALAEINSKRMKPGKGTAINNWNAHRLKEVGEIGYVLNNREFITWAIENLKSHININLYPDGTSLDFKQRDAMHYHLYDLEPLLKLAIMINRGEGNNFYTYQSSKGSSIKKSVDWLLPYVKGEKQHEEYVNTTVKFDRERAKNNEPGFAPGTMFDPKLALPLLKTAVYFDPSLAEIYKGLKGSDNILGVADQIKNEKRYSSN